MTLSSAFFDTAQLALDCICETMNSLETDIEGYSCPCLAYVSPGQPAFDNCCDDCADGGSGGQLTVHVSDIFQSDDFPVEGSFIHPCKASVWVANLVVTVARCTPSQDNQGNPPSPEALSDNALLLNTDLYAVLQALICCLPQEAVPGKRTRRVTLNQVGTTEIDTEGGCAGIEVRASVEVQNVCGCVQTS